MADLNLQIDVFQISLQLRGTTSVCSWTRSFFEDVLRRANSIWAQANIVIDVRSYTPQEFELLNPDSNLSLTSGNDKAYLLSQHRGGHGLGVCLVNTVVTSDGFMLGGYYEPQYHDGQLFGRNRNG